MTLWLTGRPCSGKTTIAEQLNGRIKDLGLHVVNLDGDAVRDGLCKDLGFSAQDRRENLRRVAHVCRLFNDNGAFVIATFITPTNELRDFVKEIIPNFKMCYVSCSLETAEKRDVKGMYKKARQGIIKEFTGVSAPFEEPVNPDIIVDSEKLTLEDCVQQILLSLEGSSLMRGV
jgi:adenylylsulfate kinase